MSTIVVKYKHDFKVKAKCVEFANDNAQDVVDALSELVGVQILVVSVELRRPEKEIMAECRHGWITAVECNKTDLGLRDWLIETGDLVADK